MFTCLNSRAVHIEITWSMETDSFILALRRVISRRGNIRSIQSDNGTNFVGAFSELQKAFNNMDHDRIQQFLSTHGTDWLIWNRNTPAASHMGGIWERQIRSARSILTALMKAHTGALTEEALCTLMSEAEAIVNSRPLTVESLSDVDSPRPLTPSHLLTMKSQVVMPPPGAFSSPDVYSRKQWRRVQHLANEFWSRWRKEFLTNLQERQKWNQKTRNFKINDVVLLKGESNRCEWPMARVINTYPDNDGVVRSIDLLLSKRSFREKETILKRPINKVVLLVEATDSEATL